MEILSIFDPRFRPYGRIVEGCEALTGGILAALANTPQTGEVCYVPEDPALQALPEAKELGLHLYGGLHVEFGWCNGRNTLLNCLEYHRDSEFNLGTEDFILLLAKQEDIENGILDTGKVRAFRVPAGVLIEVYATTLHYAPCHTDPAKGFRVCVALPAGTNTEIPSCARQLPEDRLLFARNKWLLAHPDAAEAARGAYIGLSGSNIDIAPLIGGAGSGEDL